MTNDKSRQRRTLMGNVALDSVGSMERFLDRVLASSLSGMYVYNVTEGHNDFINAQYTAITGWTLDELNALSGEQFASLFHDEDRAAIYAHINDVVSAKTDETVDIEYRFRTKDGRWIWCKSKDGPFERDADGNVIRFIGTFLDITESKRIRDELVNLNRLKSLGALAGSIAHNFNNVLHMVFGAIDFARFELDPDHPLQEVLAEAAGAELRATRLTEELVTFALGGVPRTEPTPLEPLIRDVLRSQVHEGFEVHLQVERGLSLVAVDRNQIRQVFANLALNSVQASGDSGAVTIELHEVTIDTRSVLDLTPGSYVRVRFHDTGSGVLDRHQESVFEPFFTTKASGLGLGLTTARSIVTHHGGTMVLEAASPAGSTFAVYLPTTTASPVVIEPDSQPVLELGTRILIMDDEPKIRTLLSRVLQRRGAICVTAADGEAAVTAYAEAHGTPDAFDAIVMDLKVPRGMGGIEAMAKILEIDPEAVGVISSGYTDVPALADPEAYGFRGGLSKPYSADQLVRLLNRARRVS